MPLDDEAYEQSKKEAAALFAPPPTSAELHRSEQETLGPYAPAAAGTLLGMATGGLGDIVGGLAGAGPLVQSLISSLSTAAPGVVMGQPVSQNVMDALAGGIGGLAAHAVGSYVAGTPARKLAKAVGTQGLAADAPEALRGAQTAGVNLSPEVQAELTAPENRLNLVRQQTRLDPQVAADTARALQLSGNKYLEGAVPSGPWFSREQAIRTGQDILTQDFSQQKGVAGAIYQSMDQIPELQTRTTFPVPGGGPVVEGGVDLGPVKQAVAALDARGQARLMGLSPKLRALMDMPDHVNWSTAHDIRSDLFSISKQFDLPGGATAAKEAGEATTLSSTLTDQMKAAAKNAPFAAQQDLERANQIWQGIQSGDYASANLKRLMNENPTDMLEAVKQLGPGDWDRLTSIYNRADPSGLALQQLRGTALREMMMAGKDNAVGAGVFDHNAFLDQVSKATGTDRALIDRMFPPGSQEAKTLENARDVAVLMRRSGNLQGYNPSSAFQHFLGYAQRHTAFRMAMGAGAVAMGAGAHAAETGMGEAALALGALTTGSLLYKSLAGSRASQWLKLAAASGGMGTITRATARPLVGWTRALLDQGNLTDEERAKVQTVHDAALPLASVQGEGPRLQSNEQGAIEPVTPSIATINRLRANQQ